MPCVDATPALAPPPPDLARDASLFIDFDGTLVELAARPEAVALGPATAALLVRLADAFPGRVAIVSGRSIAQLDHFLGGFARRVALAGSHGVERRSADGVLEAPAAPPGLAAAIAAMEDFARRDEGLIVEPKRFGVTLHYRLAPALADAADRFAAELATRHGMAVQRGKMMAELKVAGGDKGGALRALMQTPAMRGTRPLFLGDDLTDEAGFAAAAAAGGAGILVGPPRATAAAFALADVAAVHAWLAQAVEVAA